MKYFFIIVLLSFNSWSFTDKELMEQLSQIHGSQWSGKIKTYGTNLIRSKLKNFLQQPETFSFWKDLDQSDKEDLYRNGISEFGHFAAKSGTLLTGPDYKFLMSMAKSFNYDWTSRGALSWYVAFKNTASNQGLETLMDIFEQVPDTEIATKFTLIRTMQEMLVRPEVSSDESLDYQVFGKDRVEPNLDASYQNGILKQVYSNKLQSIIADFLKNSDFAVQHGELKTILQGYIRALKNNENKEKVVLDNNFSNENDTQGGMTTESTLSASSGAASNSNPANKVKNIGRNLASVPDDETKNGDKSYIGYFFILMLPLFIGYFFYRKKVD